MLPGKAAAGVDLGPRVAALLQTGTGGNPAPGGYGETPFQTGCLSGRLAPLPHGNQRRGGDDHRPDHRPGGDADRAGHWPDDRQGAQTAAGGGRPGPLQGHDQPGFPAAHRLRQFFLTAPSGGQQQLAPPYIQINGLIKDGSIPAVPWFFVHIDWWIIDPLLICR